MRVTKIRVRHQIGFVILTALSLIAYVGLVRLDWLVGTLRDQYTPHTIAWYLVAFAAFLGLLIWAENNSVPMKWAWAAAIGFRLLLLFTTPTLSDDVYRYLWDGYVANNGVSPYAYAIDAPELDILDIPQRTQANNTWMASPYLPVAQWIFAAQAFIFPLTPFFLQLLMIIFDLLSGLLIARLLTLAVLPAHYLLIYLWNPLVILEIAHSAHIDAWMIFLTLLAIWLTFKSESLSSGLGQFPTEKSAEIEQYWPNLPRRIGAASWARIAAPLVLALATLTKILPVLTIPVLFWRWSWRQWLLYGLATIGFLLPSAWRAGWGVTGPLDGTGLFGALRIYGSVWKFNSGLFYGLEQVLTKQGLGDPLSTSKQIVFGSMVVVLFVVWLVARRQKGFRVSLRLTAVPFMAYILLTPTVHPWYILVLIAFLPFLAPGEGESRWLWLLVLPWLYLSGALIFSYLTYLDPLNFGELEWVRRLQWIPTLILLLLTPIVFAAKYRTVK